MKPCFRDVQQGGLFFLVGSKQKGLILGGKESRLAFADLFSFCGGERKKSCFDVGFEEIPSIFV